MNFDPSVQWYRRFAIGDRWPNKTFWTVFEANTGGVWLLIERHTRGCSCSYCRGEHGHGLLWMPEDRARGWRVLNFFHRLYVRWVWHSPDADDRPAGAAGIQGPISGDRSIVR